LPGLQKVVQPRAGQQPESVKSRIPVYLLPDRDKGEYFFYAIQKDLILKEEETGRTQDPEVVDRMHHRHLPPPGSYEYGRTGPEEPVMNMNDIRPEPADLPIHPDKRKRVKKEEQEFKRRIFPVIEKKGADRATRFFHQFYLAFIHDIFPSALYIVSMYIKYSHGFKFVPARSLFST
jgi:hypothetical protein